MRKRRIMQIAAIVVMASIVLFFVVPRREADWTIMVYLCGDNDLYVVADHDFRRIASVGSTERVNIIVQFDRRTGIVGGAPNDPNWPETLRFRVTRGMQALRATAYRNLGEQNMARGSTLAEFVSQTQQDFPAKRYALIMWGHGYGYLYSARGMFGSECEEAMPLPVPASYKHGTPDWTDESVLYNRDLADSLRGVLKRPLDLLVFDECLMGMVETVYGMHGVADVMVGSEELVPGSGLRYEAWLGLLTRLPWLGRDAVARAIVKTYQLEHYRCSTYTMSAIDVARGEAIADSISALASALVNDLEREVGAVLSARKACRSYAEALCASMGGGKCIPHIDLEQFCRELITRTSNWRIRLLALKVILELRRATIVNGPAYASSQVHGSHGLAIYFPSDANSYCADTNNECGYEKLNEVFPVEFVTRSSWSDFLHAYFALVTDKDAAPNTVPAPVMVGNCYSINNCRK